MQSKEIQYLTGLRGVAVLLVYFAHALPGHFFNKPIAYLGMSLFFMLSGTVLTFTWTDKFLKNTQPFNIVSTSFSFIWARFARLAPLYLIVAIPYFASSGRPWEELKLLIPRFMFAMQSWRYDVASYGSIKQLLVYALSWSISSECFLYILFPAFIFFIFFNKRKSSLFVLSAYIFYVSILVYLTQSNIYTGNGYPPSQTWLDWFVYISPYGRVFEFLMGIFVGLTLLRTNKNTIASARKNSFHGLIAIILIFSIVRFLTFKEADNTTGSALALLRMGPLFTLPLFYLMFSLAKGADITERLFSFKPLVTIGTWSYSIYLLEGHGLPLFGQLWQPGISTEIYHITHFVVVLLLAAGSYQVIETPCRRFLLKIDPFKKLTRHASESWHPAS